MQLEQKDYVAIMYTEEERPFTKYPDQLTKYLGLRFHMLAGQKLLDVGCGRGDFLRGFIRYGLDCYGVDQTDSAQKICPEAEIKVADLEQKLPYGNNVFDFVYSKSVIEHFYYPEKLAAEMYRVLKPGGILIALTPDWEKVYQVFFKDYTHRTPFTATSLDYFLKIHGFKNIKVEQFRQLPILWKMPWLNIFSTLTAMIMPRFLGNYSKFIFFSKEVMLLGSGKKP